MNMESRRSTQKYFGNMFINAHFPVPSQRIDHDGLEHGMLMIGEGLALWLEKDLVKCSYKVGKVLNIKWQTIYLKIHKDSENTRSFYKEPTLRNQKSKPKFLPRQWRTGRRLSPFLVALGHTSANAVKAKVGAGPLVVPRV